MTPDRCTGCGRVVAIIRVGVDKLCHVCAAQEAARCRDEIAALREVAVAARRVWDDAACNEAGDLYDVPTEKMRPLADALDRLTISDETGIT
jgi:hypothetical protein